MIVLQYVRNLLKCWREFASISFWVSSQMSEAKRWFYKAQNNVTIIDNAELTEFRKSWVYTPGDLL